jgi:TRAP-type mannitol/chloroaromatic compound transport system permease small subunit
MSKSSQIKPDAATADETPGHAPGLTFPHTRLSRIIDAVTNAVGGVVNWIWIILVMIIVVNVIMRYALGVNYIWVEEVQWHMYAVGFMIAIGYGITHDAHVRVDVVASGLRPRTRAIIEFLGITLLILPLVYLMISYAIPFVESSWRRNESSSAPGGLSNRWAIKSVIIIAFVYIGLAAFSRLLRVGAFLFGGSRGRAEG